MAYYLALKYAPDRTQVLKLVYEEEFKRAADTNRGNVSSHFVPYIGITGGKKEIICFTYLGFKLKKF